MVTLKKNFNFSFCTYFRKKKKKTEKQNINDKFTIYPSKFPLLDLKKKKTYKLN